MRQQDDRLHDGEVVVVGGQTGDKGAVYLQYVQRQAFEVSERAITGTKVVNRHADPRIVQGSEDRLGCLQVADQYLLGDFQLQPVWRKAGFFQYL
ncbi:hypothetical protein ULG90_02555 [Halopseudomonas pachastrellae]|nr:hypothetical protein ULG90_02555 [Halopseudomonas pachastrellae]